MTEPPLVPGGSASRVFVFVAGQPVRYLGLLVSKLQSVEHATLDLESDAEAVPDTDSQGYSTVDFAIRTHARQRERGALRVLPRTSALLTVSLGDAPSPRFTLAVTESQLPGGHSPAYFAVLNQPLPTSPFRWRNDPVSFDNFPSFFLAHEIAHQWWGQAVG
jgi:hypothetical protein